MGRERTPRSTSRTTMREPRSHYVHGQKIINAASWRINHKELQMEIARQKERQVIFAEERQRPATLKDAPGYRTLAIIDVSPVNRISAKCKRHNARTPQKTDTYRIHTGNKYPARPIIFEKWVPNSNNISKKNI